ncbi:MAG: pilus assembly protein PilP [Azoarcus sp.]|nr:pilus assembly protein PilP [Azoarcus sp.]
MRSALVLTCCVLMFGCASEQDDINGWMSEQAISMVGVVKPLPEIKSFSPVDFVAVADVADPFDPVRIEPAAKRGTRRDDEDMRRREPLEAYPLESLRMVGMLSRGRQVHALIQAGPSLYQVGVGNYMGADFGKITAITESAVELQELVEDMNGDWTERTNSLQLQEQQAGGK